MVSSGSIDDKFPIFASGSDSIDDKFPIFASGVRNKYIGQSVLRYGDVASGQYLSGAITTGFSNPYNTSLSTDVNLSYARLLRLEKLALAQYGDEARLLRAIIFDPSINNGARAALHDFYLEHGRVEEAKAVIEGEF